MTILEKVDTKKSSLRCKKIDAKIVVCQHALIWMMQTWCKVQCPHIALGSASREHNFLEKNALACNSYYNATTQYCSSASTDELLSYENVGDDNYIHINKLDKHYLDAYSYIIPNSGFSKRNSLAPYKEVLQKLKSKFESLKHKGVCDIQVYVFVIYVGMRASHASVDYNVLFNIESDVQGTITIQG